MAPGGYYGKLTVWLPCSHGEDTKHGLPSRSNVVSPSLDHLDQTPQHHVLDGNLCGIAENVLKRFQKVLLKLEARELLNLHEPHRQLAERVESKVDDIGVVVAADLDEVGTKNLPNTRPLEAHTSHVVP